MATSRIIYLQNNLFCSQVFLLRKLHVAIIELNFYSVPYFEIQIEFAYNFSENEQSEKRFFPLLSTLLQFSATPFFEILQA